MKKILTLTAKKISKKGKISYIQIFGGVYENELIWKIFNDYLNDESVFDINIIAEDRTKYDSVTINNFDIRKGYDLIG